MIFTDHKGNSLRFEHDGLDVWRSSFDKWLMPLILPGCTIDYGVGRVLMDLCWWNSNWGVRNNYCVLLIQVQTHTPKMIKSHTPYINNIVFSLS